MNMNADKFLKKFIKGIKNGKQAVRSTAPVHQPDEMLVKLLRMVEDTDEIELSCDEVFEIIDQYVELEARGDDVSQLLPLVRQHLDRCRACQEEYEALARIIKATSS